MRAMKDILWLNPLAVRFTHAEISPAFQNRDGLDATIEKVLRRELSADAFQDAPLEVVQKDGIFWSLSNRRLYVFRVAHAFGYCGVCPCKVTQHDSTTDEQVTNRLREALSSTTKGKLVLVRQGGSRYQGFESGHPVDDQAAGKLRLPSMDQFMSRLKLVMGLTPAELKTCCDCLEKEGCTSVCSLFDLADLSLSETQKLALPSQVQKNICLMLARPYPFADFADNYCHGGQTAQLRTSAPSNCPGLGGQSGRSTTKVEGGATTQANQPDPAEETRQLEYLKGFCERRELSRPARKDLFSLRTSAAYDLAFSLEAVKKAEGHSHSPEEWSRYVSSRVAARREQGELSETQIERIDLLIQAVTREARVSPKKVAELGSTLRILSPSELENILGRNFTKKVLSGSIVNPAGYVNAIAVRIRKDQVAEMIPHFVSQWQFSSRAERALRHLCWINSNATKKLMNPHQASRGEHSLLSEIQTRQGNSYASRSSRSVQLENHKLLEAEWSDDEAPGVADTAACSDEPEEPIPDNVSETSEEPDILEGLPPSEDIFTVPVTGPALPQTQLAAHFVFVLDISGSMSNCDCVRQDGSVQERIQAVKELLGLLAHAIEREQQTYFGDTALSDVFSAVTFNTRYCTLFTLKAAKSAAEMLQNHPIHPWGQTHYTSGLAGIEACVQRAEQCTETQGRPTYVLFLSDDDPSDPGEFTSKLNSLMLSPTRIRINTIAFGPSGASALHLQQLAFLGDGECRPASTSVASLRAAFSAARSTMTTSRLEDSFQASRGRLGSSSGIPAGIQGKGQRVCFRDESGTVRQAIFVKWNLDGTAEVKSLDCEGRERLQISVPQEQIWWPSPLQLEPADPTNIFHPNSEHGWEHWEQGKKAWRCQYRFDGTRFQIGEMKETTIWRRVKFFNKGKMRIVRFMCDAEMGRKRLLVCKHLLVPHCSNLEIQASTKADVAPFLRNSAVARYYAQSFRRKNGGILGFRKDYLYQMEDEPESTRVFMAELHMNGMWIKFNNNAGSVNKVEHRHHSDLAQSFSHYTFEESNGELLVVDVQGIQGITVGDEKTRDVKLHLTDPQVHCRGGSFGSFESFGKGDHQEMGITRFFQTHVCNRWCRQMKLRRVSEYGFIPPTAMVTLPGPPEDVCQLPTAQALCAKHRLTEVVFTKEREVKLWGRPRRANRAKEAIKDLLEDLASKSVQRHADGF